MPTLVLTIFMIQLSIHLINTIGASTINDLLWNLYARFPTSSSQSLREQWRLRAEVVHLKREMASTSAQDNFAKWAKIRREHDRALQRHDEIASSNSSARSRFDTYASVTRWISTNGLRLVLQFWHARTPVFALPSGGWVPGAVEWMVGLPGARGVKGGVSVQVWGWVCVVVISVVGEAVEWAVKSSLDPGRNVDAEAKMKMKMAGGGRGRGR